MNKYVIDIMNYIISRAEDNSRSLRVVSGLDGNQEDKSKTIISYGGRVLEDNEIIKWIRNYDSSEERLIKSSKKPIMIISSARGFPGMVIKYEELPQWPVSLVGYAHNIEHSTTRTLFERRGAEYLPGKNITVDIGEYYLACSLKRELQSDKRWDKQLVIRDLIEVKCIKCTRVG